MNGEDTRHAWVAAVLEGRFATADYLAPDLPAADTCDLTTPPENDRESFACAGEIFTGTE